MEQLVIGAGGACGLMLDRALCRATSGCCHTFDSPPLPLVAAGSAPPPPRSSPRRSPRNSGTEEEPELSPGTPPPRATVEAMIETVELWGLDEHACRTMRDACSEHVPIRSSAVPPPELAPIVPPGSHCPVGYSVSACLTPSIRLPHVANE